MNRKPARPGEFDVIGRHFAPLARGDRGAFGLKDDAALLVPRAGHGLIITTDAIVEGVHFLRTDPPSRIAQKALRVNLSDLAAKGARPRCYFMTTAWPDWVDERWIAAFAEGLAHDQAQFGITLSGGDTVRTPGPLSVSITALGEIKGRGMVRRAGARVGDDVWVTGTVGDAGLGLRVAQGLLPASGVANGTFLLGRYQVPQPRVAFGAGLSRVARGAIDVSDGLVADLGHVARCSGLSLEIDPDLVPLSAAARHVLSRGLVTIADLLGAGDDYEIAFTAPASARRQVLALGARSSTQVSRIGACRKGEAGVVVRDASGTILRPTWTGFTHF